MNRKKLKILAFFLIVNLIFVSFITVSADDSTDTVELKIHINNLNEPVVGQVPNFNYDVEKYYKNGEVTSFNFICWLEIDLPYEDIINFIDMVASNTQLDESSIDMDYLKEVLLRSRYLINEEIVSNSLDNDTEMLDQYNISTIDKFVANRTYIALFTGETNSTFLLGNGRSSPNSVSTSSLRSLGDFTPSNLDLSINGNKNNVFGALQRGKLTMFAIFNPIIPTTSCKATINWIDAKGHVPESFVLRLMNGDTVVSEHTLTKENAVEDSVWEYDFGEYPIIDDNCNGINYTLAYEEKNQGDLKFYNTSIDGFTITNTYVAPDVKSQLKISSLVDREINNVKYKINYSTSIKKYSGNAVVTITATLPFDIDENKSDLDNGIYDSKTHSITWTESIKDIDNIYNYSTSKNVNLYLTAVLPYSIETTAVGEIKLTDAYEFSESVDAIDNIEVGTGNPKTGDTNLQKYLSIGLVGIAAILIVFSIKRKYSTKKIKVQF